MSTISYDLETFEDRIDEYIETLDLSVDLSEFEGGPPKVFRGKSLTIQDEDERAKRLAWWREERELELLKKVDDEREKIREKAALKVHTARIVGIFATNIDTGESYNKVADNISEYDLISGFYTWLEDIETGYGPPNLYAWCGDFDEYMLKGRALVHKIKPRYRWGFHRTQDALFGRYNKNARYMKLDDMGFMLDIRKVGKGSDVAAMVREERWDDLYTYGIRDNDINTEALRRAGV